ARSIRDFAFVGLTAGNHGVAISGNRWVFSGASDTSEDFTRTVSVRSIDAYKKYVTSTVSWEFRPGQTKSVVLSTLIANWRDKRTGTVELLEEGSLDLPGNADGIGLAVSGTRAYIGRAATAESEFIVVDVSNTAAPITIAEIDMVANLYDLVTYSTYVYGASGVNAGEVQVIDISSSTLPVVVNQIDLAGNGDATAVVVSGTRLYVTREPQGANPTFHVLDITTPSLPVELGGLYLGDGAEDLEINEGAIPYVFIAGHSDAQEFQVVNTATPTAMVVGGSWNEPADIDDFRGVAVSGTIAYATSLVRATVGEFWVFNISNPLAPTNLSSLEIGADAYSIEVPATKGVVVVGSASSTAELMAIDAADPVNPVITQKIDHAGPINDLAIQQGYVYTVTGVDSLEFRIFRLY
ncbi:MAG: hypothetical protein ABH820_02940, partial [Patescibacteria group bacterium]